MVNFTLDEVRRKKRKRNMSALAQIDHHKPTVTDSFVSEAGNTAAKADEMRLTDAKEGEQERCTTIKPTSNGPERYVLIARVPSVGRNYHEDLMYGDKRNTYQYGSEGDTLFIKRKAAFPLQFRIEKKNTSRLYIRVKAVYSHSSSEDNKSEFCFFCKYGIERDHFVRCEHPSAIHQISKTKVCSVVIPFEDPPHHQKFTTYNFKCMHYSSCGLHRSRVILVFQLESESLEILHRSTIGFEVCDNPLLDCMAAERKISSKKTKEVMEIYKRFIAASAPDSSKDNDSSALTSGIRTENYSGITKLIDEEDQPPAKRFFTALELRPRIIEAPQYVEKTSRKVKRSKESKNNEDSVCNSEANTSKDLKYDVPEMSEELATGLENGAQAERNILPSQNYQQNASNSSSVFTSFFANVDSVLQNFDDEEQRIVMHEMCKAMYNFELKLCSTKIKKRPKRSDESNDQE